MRSTVEKPFSMGYNVELRSTEGKKETDRLLDRETDRQTERQTFRQRDRQADRKQIVYTFPLLV